MKSQQIPNVAAANDSLEEAKARLGQLSREALELDDPEESDRLEKEVSFASSRIDEDILAHKKILEDQRLAQIEFNAPSEELETEFFQAFQDLSTIVKNEQEGSKVLRAITQVVSIVGEYATFNLTERG